MWGGVFAGIVFWIGGKIVLACLNQLGLDLLWLRGLGKVVYLFLVERFFLFGFSLNIRLSLSVSFLTLLLNFTHLLILIKHKLLRILPISLSSLIDSHLAAILTAANIF